MEETQGIPEMPQFQSTPTQAVEPKGKSKSAAIITVIILLILAIGGIFLLQKKGTVKPIAQNVIQNTPTVTPTPLLNPTPIISPVTSANVDQTLTTTDTAVQQTINQANADFNNINNIDKSQDSTTGL